mmetsp:Transcript_35509/g.68972  ORF Transcript_35509/g.68972 Transcript_35509/m.68972 type:complete len:200 (-) Transcript_35509:123-722(-)
MGKIKAVRIKTPQQPLPWAEARTWTHGVNGGFTAATPPNVPVDHKKNTTRHLWRELFANQQAQDLFLSPQQHKQILRQQQKQRQRQNTSFKKRLKVEILRKQVPTKKEFEQKEIIGVGRARHLSKMRTARIPPRICTNMVMKHVAILQRPRPLAMQRRKKRLRLKGRALSLDGQSHRKKLSWNGSDDLYLNRPMSELSI